MKPLLPQLIDNFQNAFVSGRQRGNNVLISHDLLHTINKQRTGSCHLATFKLHMNKAYDQVSWLFLLKILTAYGFPEHWIQLISPTGFWLMVTLLHPLYLSTDCVRVTLCPPIYFYFAWLSCRE